MLEKLELKNIERFKNLWMMDIMQNKRLMHDRPDVLEKIFNDNFRIAKVHLVNSHKNTEEDIDLIEFIDTVFRECVIMIENGVLLSSKEEDFSPAVEIEAELKADRKKIKKEANFNLTEGDKALGARQDIIQNMIKLIMNRRFRTLERVCA